LTRTADELPAYFVDPGVITINWVWYPRFAALGQTPRLMQGAADLYRLVGETPLADQTSREPDPSLEAVLEGLAERAGAG